MINSIVYVSHDEGASIYESITCSSFEIFGSANILVLEAKNFSNTNTLLRPLMERYKIVVETVEPLPFIELHWVKLLEKNDLGVTLLICADEILKGSIEPKIAKQEWDTIRIQRANYIGDRELIGGGWGRTQDYQTRIFRKLVKTNAEVEIHRLPFEQGKVIASSTLTFLHNSYESLSDFISRFNRYTTLQIVEANRVSVYKLLYRSIKHFFRRYIWQRGYRDGALGIVICGLMGLYLATTYAKREEE